MPKAWVKMYHGFLANPKKKPDFSRLNKEKGTDGFYFIDKVTLMLMTIGFLASKVIPGIGIKEILFMTVYFLFLYSMQQGKWIEEINRHYIYLIPDKSFRILFFWYNYRIILISKYWSKYIFY